MNAKISECAAVLAGILIARRGYYPSASRIARLSVSSKAYSDEWINLNGRQVIQLQQATPVQSVLAMDYHLMTLTGPEFPENVNVIGLISTGFQDLGVPPLLGRGIAPLDAIAGHLPVKYL
jgi:hypothetical protein